jgi:hypothetical protein
MGQVTKIGRNMILSREIHAGKPLQNLAERPYTSIMM